MYPNTQDGNTATQAQDALISPVSGAVSQEDSDMINKVKEYIDRGINALVNQSKLHDEVAQLRQDIALMQEQVDKVRKDNSWLDEQLVRIRVERDTALKTASEAETRMGSLAQEVDDVNRKLNIATRLAGEDGEKIAQLQKERDDAQFKAMELEEELAKVRSKIEKFLNLADEIDPPQEPQGQLSGSTSPVQVPITQSWDAPKPVEPTQDEPWKVPYTSDDRYGR